MRMSWACSFYPETGRAEKEHFQNEIQRRDFIHEILFRHPLVRRKRHYEEPRRQIQKEQRMYPGTDCHIPLSLQQIRM